MVFADALLWVLGVPGNGGGIGDFTRCSWGDGASLRFLWSITVLSLAYHDVSSRIGILWSKRKW
jgi:hypothetical protein